MKPQSGIFLKELGFKVTVEFLFENELWKK